MDNAMYVGLSKQILLQRELDIVANNLANVDTTGFKVEDMVVATDSATPAMSVGVTQPVKFAIDNGVARDFTQGSMTQTGAPLDLAINGTGFFQVQTAAGVRFTRDGRFATNAQSQHAMKSRNSTPPKTTAPPPVRVAGHLLGRTLTSIRRRL